MIADVSVGSGIFDHASWKDPAITDQPIDSLQNQMSLVDKNRQTSNISRTLIDN